MSCLPSLMDGFVVLRIEPRTTSSLSGSHSVLYAKASSKKAHLALRKALSLYLRLSEWKASGQPLMFGSYQNRSSHSKQVQHLASERTLMSSVHGRARA